MNILVLGGSYFIGKCFVNMVCHEHKVYVFNRGNKPLNISGVEEIVGNRHNVDDLAKLNKYKFDVVVDFCAYYENDIRNVIEALNGKIKQYIFISTGDVYKHGVTNKLIDESFEFENRNIPGEAGAYIYGKIILENELANVCEKFKIKYTSIRPAMVYGPGNYVPREGIYFHWIKQSGQILHPVSATGELKLVFVEDVARAIRLSINNENAYNQAFNLASDEITTYDTFTESLKKAVDTEFSVVEISLETVVEKNIQLPFPLYKEESNLYDGGKAKVLIGKYTDLIEGLKITYNSIN